MNRIFYLPFLALVAASLAGCGPDGCEVSGTVQFGGKPLADGGILFEPDGFEGPAASTGVAEGRYDVSSAKRLKPGRYKVRVTQPGGRSGEDNPISFPPYVTTINVEERRAELNFDVPGPNQPGGPAPTVNR